LDQLLEKLFVMPLPLSFRVAIGYDTISHL
jgi:hypothetical protein